MIKVKLTTPKEPAVNISLDEETAQELLSALQEFTAVTNVADSLKEFIGELEAVL